MARKAEEKSEEETLVSERKLQLAKEGVLRFSRAERKKREVGGNQEVLKTKEFFQETKGHEV